MTNKNKIEISVTTHRSVDTESSRTCRRVNATVSRTVENIAEATVASLYELSTGWSSITETFRQTGNASHSKRCE